KALLKAARDDIAKKDYPAARQKCQDILDLDPTNYHALVYLGVAEEKEGRDAESEAAYRKAVAANPESPLAYQ
ncbi:hypothetical protein BDK51DRAFT_1701, partial [Blyttiomyces helicus]